MAKFTVCVEDSNILITSEEVDEPCISCNVLSKDDFSAFSLTGLQNCLFCFFQVQASTSLPSTRLMDDGWLSKYGMIALAFKALCYDHQAFGIKSENFLEAILKLSSFGVLDDDNNEDNIIKHFQQEAKHQSDESFDEIAGADPAMHKCQTCDKRLLSKRKLEIHHSDIHETQAHDSLYNGDRCNQQITSVRESCPMVSDEILNDSNDEGDVCYNDESEIDGSSQLVIDLGAYEEEGTVIKPKNVSCNLFGTQCKQTNRKVIGPFICDKCGKVYTQAAGLRLHVSIVHLQEKKFQCDVCKKCFGRSDSLTKHMRSHTNERSYICEFCSLAFNQSSHLIKHRRIKHLDLNRESHRHVCEICSGRFYSKGELEKHNRITHEGIKDFSCLICQHKFGGRAMCRRHVKKVHKINVPVLGDHFDKMAPFKFKNY